MKFFDIKRDHKKNYTLNYIHLNCVQTPDII